MKIFENFFGAYMRSIREKAKFSIEEASLLLGIDSSQIHGWESGESLPTEALLEKIALTYKIPLGEFREIFNLEVKLREIRN